MPEIEPQQPQHPDILDLGLLRQINGGGGPISSGGSGGGSGGGGGQGAYPAHYTITLENFRIDQTWSFHHDTDFVDFAVKVGGQPAPNSPQHKSMGDLNNGTFSVGISYDIIVPSADTLVITNYQIINHGHDGNAEQIMSALDHGSDSMADDPGVGTVMTQDSSTDTGQGESTWDQIVKFSGGYVVSLFTTDCDAIVAANQILATGAMLASSTAPGRHEITKRFTKSSPHGCGTSDADYTVTLSIIRTS